MQLTSITEIIIFLVFVAGFIVFSLHPAIYISEAICNKIENCKLDQHKLALGLTILFSIGFTSFIFFF